MTEVAQLALQDVLVPSGALCAEISLRAQITKGCRQRYIYLSHIKAVEAFDRYLDYRIVRCYARLAIPAGVEEWNRQAADLDAQGLHVLPEYKAACELGGAGQAGYLACNSLQSQVRKMYWNAGVRPGSSHSTWGTTASRSIAQGHAVEIVQQLRGQAKLDDGRHCLQMSQKRIRSDVHGQALAGCIVGKCCIASLKQAVAVAR